MVTHNPFLTRPFSISHLRFSGGLFVVVNRDGQQVSKAMTQDKAERSAQIRNIQTRNARFWVYHSGSKVKLTIEPGRSIVIQTGGPTDEGWSRRWARYTHQGETIGLEWDTQSVDCDGRMDRSGDLEAPIDSSYPDWREIRSTQRDYEAERAGY